MPAAFAAPAIGSTLLGIGGAAGAAASIYGANKSAGSSRNAARMEQEAIDKQLAYEREVEQRRREEFDRTEAENKRRWDVEAGRDEYRWGVDQAANSRGEARHVDRFNMEQRRAQPLRDVGLASVEELARNAGLTVRATDPPQLGAPPPPPAAYVPAAALSSLAKEGA